MLNIGFMGYMSEYGGGNELTDVTQLKSASVSKL